MRASRVALVLLLVGSVYAQQYTCVAGNISTCNGNQAGPSGAIAGTFPHVCVDYNVSYSTGNANRKLDIYYLCSEGLTGKHLHCSAGGPIFTDHGGGGNSGDKQSFAFEGYSDFPLWVEALACPVYNCNYTLNVSTGSHWITPWQDIMACRRSIANHIAAGSWPGTMDGGFTDITFSWGSVLSLLTTDRVVPLLLAAGYTESSEYTDSYTVRAAAEHGVVWEFKDACDHVPSGGCSYSNATTLLPVAIGNQFNSTNTSSMDADAATATAAHGYGWITGAPITYVASLPRMYASNGASDTLLVPADQINEAIAAYQAAGLPPLSYMLTPEGSGGHQGGLFLQYAGATWTNLLLAAQNTGRVANVGGGFKGVFGSF